MQWYKLSADPGSHSWSADWRSEMESSSVFMGIPCKQGSVTPLSVQLTLAVIVVGIGEWQARAALRIAARLRGQL